MAFDLGKMLSQVSGPDTGMEQIEYIPLDLLDSDPNNFYKLDAVPELADNISLCGLQQPIRVREQEDGRYMIVSGHRRRAALEMLVADGYEKWKDAPCIIERDEVSPALQQLRLIYANASTRKLTPAEISEQALQVEKLLYQLKEEGYAFPGRMRDHVAQAVGASKTKLARLKVIRDNLAECWQDAWSANEIGESVAYALSQHPHAWQQLIYNQHGAHRNMIYESSVNEFMSRFEKLSKVECAHGFCLGCVNQTAMMEKSTKDRWSEPCRTGCCYDCPSLTSCKSSCIHCADIKAEKKRVAKEASQASQREQEAKDAPTLDLIRSVYQRVGQIREANNVSVEALFKAQRKIYAVTDEKTQENLEAGTAKISTNTNLPFGYSFYPSNAMALIRVADALGCSIDYLLGRTDCPDMVKETKPQTAVWQTGNPEKLGTYVLIFCSNKYSGPRAEVWNWDGEMWYQFCEPYDEDIDGKIYGWAPMLDMTEIMYG